MQTPFAEFIPARIDTKQRLGELFIQHPTKLEMFGLRQVSSKPPKFEHPKPLFELPETSRSIGDSMQLSQPQLIATERKEIIIPPNKQLQSHHGRHKNELPPILAHPNISPPPFQLIASKTERKQKSLGKLSFGRLSKKCEVELVKQLTQQMERQFSEPVKFTKGALLKYQNLKRSKQISLSQAIKEFKKTQIIEDKSNMFELFKQKEKELNSLISGFETNSIDDII